MESIQMPQESTMYQFRIDKKEKQEVFQVFNELGIKPSQAIKMFFRQVKETRSIPFDVRLPNKETAHFLSLSDDKKDYEKVEKASDLLLDLDD